MVAGSNIKYALLLAWLAFLVAMTDVRQWKAWLVGSPGEKAADLMIEDDVRYIQTPEPVTAVRLAKNPHDKDDDDNIPSDDDALGNASATISSYSTDNIVRTVHSMILAPARLLMYHPSENTFVAFTLSPANSSEPSMTRSLNVCLRCKSVLPIMIDALLAARPERFQPDQPPFQMFFSIADFATSVCMQDGYDCHESGKSFAPWVHFGSAFRDLTILPTVQIMPTSNYLLCLWEWRWNNSLSECTKWKLPNTTYDWNNLTSKVIWRGTGFPFLPQVGLQVFQRKNETTVTQIPIEPRRMAHDWSAANPGGWLDSQILPWQKHTMTINELSQYKYQVDFGGAGGTTWTGTLTKLSMPGLLLHHETPTMDWFFDELKPWYHYVPVRTDLSDLKDRFEWAEANPEQAQQIAQRGSNFSTYFFSNEKMRYEYEQLCEKLGKVVDSYKSMESVESILDTYKWGKVTAIQHSTCTKDYCDIFIKVKNSTRYDLPPR